jgi:hypothetical protein
MFKDVGIAGGSEQLNIPDPFSSCVQSVAGTTGRFFE